MKIDLFEGPKGDRPITALALLLTAVFALALQDSMVKYVSTQTSFWQIQTLRSFCNVTFVILLALAGSGIHLLIPKNKTAVSLRAVFMTVCMFCFFAGAPYLTVAQMAAGLYTYPLFVSLLAGPVLGEKVGRWRIGALILGVFGAAFILNPWDENFSMVQWLPIMSGFFYALNILTIRSVCRNESPLALAFSVGIAFVVSGMIGIAVLALFPPAETFQQSMPFIAIGWPTLTLTIVGFAVFFSVLNLTGNICIVRAYQTADSSWLAPMDFTYLIFAAIWSRVLFDQWPTRQAIMGMVLIAIAGAVIAWRETVGTAKLAAKSHTQT